MGRRFGALLGVLALLLSACGGGGGGGGSSAGGGGGGTGSATCSLLDRQNWAAAQLREWYLFPETLPASLNPGAYATVDAYIDALTAGARAQGRDRFFTYLTSIREEDAFFSAGSNIGFGFRLSTDAAARRVFIVEAFEGAPALAAGIDRGTEIIAIGTSAATLRTVDSIIAAEGVNGVTAALGPNTTATTRVFRIADAGGTRDVSVTKADYALTPVSSRYGARIINDGGRQVGYLNLRTFIDTADPALRSAFAQFRAAGITEIIVDLRYNGGGLVSIAELMGDLLGGDRSTSEVFAYTTFRPEKASNDETRNFRPQQQSIAPTRIAFIGTAGTASASEVVINSFIPYLGNRAALVGTNTYGKPVGQIAVDRSQCDDRLRIVAFATQNAARQGAYYNGLAPFMNVTCAAGDDLAFPLGDPRESSVARALDFLAGRPCNAITGSIARSLGEERPQREGQRILLTPARPGAAQREVPGLF